MTLLSADIILENDMVRLTSLQLSDIEKLAKIAYHPQIWELGMSRISNLTELTSYVQTALDEKMAGQSLPFLIFDKVNNRVAGSTRFGNISLPHKRLEIGWTWLHPDFQRTGVNRQCKFLLLQYAFEILLLNRVEIKTDVLNMQSRNAIVAIGAKEEGIFRKHQITSRGRVRDSIFFSILSEEWAMLKSTVFKGFQSNIPG